MDMIIGPLEMLAFQSPFSNVAYVREIDTGFNCGEMWQYL